LTCGLAHQALSISIADFARVQMKVGKIATVDEVPGARKPMYRLMVDFGEDGSKQCVAGIKDRYSKEELTGKFVVAVVNLEPKVVAGVVSECMLLAAFNDKELSLLSPERQVSLGTKVG
jgi:tRNA-binding protein